MSYLLYDTEFYAYRIAAGHTEDFDFGDDDYIVRINHRDALVAFIEHAEDLLGKFSGHDLFLVRGDTRNFRHDIWPEYKANRKDRRRPPGYGKFLKCEPGAGRSPTTTESGSKGCSTPSTATILSTKPSVARRWPFSRHRSFFT